MWTKNWRDTAWSQLDAPFDLIVIGGGVTGAGILREAARAGLKTVLFEQGDFASGTSSRSSKLVHGGLRYLKNAKIKLTYESVHEREHLLREGRGLVTPLPFVMANFKNDRTPAWAFGVGLTVYDLLALKWNHTAYNTRGLRALVPQLTSPDMVSGFRFFDAQTDDARLVLRVLQEAVSDGAAAFNYARVDHLLRAKGRVCGVLVRDLEPGSDRTIEVKARAVINATGAWADELRLQVSDRRRLRVLRGSHIFFPLERLPLTRAVTFLHPRDARPVFIFPWEGVVLVGTTDVDHAAIPSSDLRTSGEETLYLLEAVRHAFPEQGLTRKDIQSTLAGIRGVVNTGKADPSKESREFVLWNEYGLLTVSGGKLTTFRLMAQTALRAVRPLMPEHPHLGRDERVLDPLPPETTLCDLPADLRLRLLGRYGTAACSLVEAAHQGEMQPISPSPSLWAELRWAARTEGVVHLDDLLARRVRLNITQPGGGLKDMQKIRNIAQEELGWNNIRWKQEEERYRQLWDQYYSPA